MVVGKKERQMRFDRAKVKADFNRAARTYDQHALVQKMAAEKVAMLAVPYIREESTVLDIGSGTGFLAQCLGREILQLDIAGDMCLQSQGYGPAINADMCFIPLKNQSVDIIISSFALQWADGLEVVLEEIYRTLKPGGMFIASLPGSGTLHELKTAFSCLDNRIHVSPFESMMSLKEKLAHFSHAEITQEEIVQYYPDVMVLLRSLKAIGASNKSLYRAESPPGKETFSRLEQVYSMQFGNEQGLPATWDILTLMGRK